MADDVGVTMAGLLRSVCERHRVAPMEVSGPCRFRELVAARKDFVRLAVSAGKWSSVQIGRFLGGRDHTSILYLAGRTKRKS